MTDRDRAPMDVPSPSWRWDDSAHGWPGDRVLALGSASVGRDEFRRVAAGITYDRAEDEVQPLLLPSTSTTSPR